MVIMVQYEEMRHQCMVRSSRKHLSLIVMLNIAAERYAPEHKMCTLVETNREGETINTMYKNVITQYGSTVYNYVFRIPPIH